MTKEEFISQIREKYPDGFLQNPRDNYQAQKLNSEGLSYEGYCLVSVSKLDSYDSISMFNSFQGGDGVEKFAVSVNLKKIEKGHWQKVFFNFVDAMNLYTELIGTDAEWYVKTKVKYQSQKVAA